MSFSSDTQELLRICLEGVMAVIGFFAVTTLGDIRKAIEHTKKSVEELNVKIAIVIEKTTNHEKQLSDHADRIRDLEKVG